MQPPRPGTVRWRTGFRVRPNGPHRPNYPTNSSATLSSPPCAVLLPSAGLGSRYTRPFANAALGTRRSARPQQHTATQATGPACAIFGDQALGESHRATQGATGAPKPLVRLRSGSVTGEKWVGGTVWARPKRMAYAQPMRALDCTGAIATLHRPVPGTEQQSPTLSGSPRPTVGRPAASVPRSSLGLLLTPSLHA
jgi:hypothetical protein